MINNAIIVLGIVLIAIGTLLTYWGADRKNSETNDQLQKLVSAKNKDIDQLIEGKNILISQNDELNKKIETYQIDLNQKQKKIEELQTAAKKSERGISIIYDYQGTKRETGPGFNNATVGNELGVYMEMEDLKANKKWNDLIALSTEQIKKTPQWYTPYLFRGIAYNETGEIIKAIQDVKLVVENTPEDPAYSYATDFLKQLQKD